MKKAALWTALKLDMRFTRVNSPKNIAYSALIKSFKPAIALKVLQVATYRALFTKNFILFRSNTFSYE